MKKTLIHKAVIGVYGSAILGLSLAALPLYAQTGASVETSAQTNVGTTGASSSVRVQLKEDIQGVRDEMKSVRASTTAAIKAERDSFMTSLKAKREAALQTLRSLRLDIKARIDAFKASSTDARAEVKVRLEADKKARVEAFLNLIIQRFENAADRLTNISGRIASKIEQLEEQGKDMDDSIELLAKADAQLTVAKEDIAKVDSEIESGLNSEISKEDLRALIAVAKQSLKDAHAAYVRVIVSIKGESGAEVHGNASTTNSN